MGRGVDQGAGEYKTVVEKNEGKDGKGKEMDNGNSGMFKVKKQ